MASYLANNILRNILVQTKKSCMLRKYAHDESGAISITSYQPVLPHGLIRTNIKTRLITNNYNYLSHALFHLLNSLTYNTIKIHTYHYLVVICLVSNNIFHFVSHLHRYVFNWTICLSYVNNIKIVFFYLPPYMTAPWVVFLYKQ
jgi:hypothetical protein